MLRAAPASRLSQAERAGRSVRALSDASGWTGRGPERIMSWLDKHQVARDQAARVAQMVARRAAAVVEARALAGSRARPAIPLAPAATTAARSNPSQTHPPPPKNKPPRPHGRGGRLNERHSSLDFHSNHGHPNWRKCSQGVLHGQSYKDSQTARSPFVFI